MGSRRCHRPNSGRLPPLRTDRRLADLVVRTNAGRIVVELRVELESNRTRKPSGHFARAEHGIAVCRSPEKEPCDGHKSAGAKLHRRLTHIGNRFESLLA